MKKILLSSIILFIMTPDAFTGNYKIQKITDPIYWDFIGNPNSQNDIENPEMYVRDPDNSPDCSVGIYLSEILAEPQVGNEDYPDLSTEIVMARTFCD